MFNCVLNTPLTLHNLFEKESKTVAYIYLILFVCMYIHAGVEKVNVRDKTFNIYIYIYIYILSTLHAFI